MNQCRAGGTPEGHSYIDLPLYKALAKLHLEYTILGVEKKGLGETQLWGKSRGYDHLNIQNKYVFKIQWKVVNFIITTVDIRTHYGKKKIGQRISQKNVLFFFCSKFNIF